MPVKKPSPLTTPDLVVLSLLAEKPMHGYQLVTELERREVRDWAGISRPQVYYSLKKLAKSGLIRPTSDEEERAGPERCVYAPTEQARVSMADALEASGWATARPPPPFLTWMVLSLHARSSAVAKMLKRRRAFLEGQVAKEKATLEAIRADIGPTVRVAEAVVRLGIQMFELELAWLEEAARALSAKNRRQRPI